MRLGLGGRGSRFVFRRKTKSNERRGYWGVAGLAVVTNLVSTVCMFFVARPLIFRNETGNDGQFVLRVCDVVCVQLYFETRGRSAKRRVKCAILEEAKRF